MADSQNGRIHKILVATGETTTLAGDDTDGNIVGPGLQAKFGEGSPRGVDWNHADPTKVAVALRGGDNNQDKFSLLSSLLPLCVN